MNNTKTRVVLDVVAEELNGSEYAPQTFSVSLLRVNTEGSDKRSEIKQVINPIGVSFYRLVYRNTTTVDSATVNVSDVKVELLGLLRQYFVSVNFSSVEDQANRVLDHLLLTPMQDQARAYFPFGARDLKVSRTGGCDLLAFKLRPVQGDSGERVLSDTPERIEAVGVDRVTGAYRLTLRDLCSKDAYSIKHAVYFGTQYNIGHSLLWPRGGCIEFSAVPESAQAALDLVQARFGTVMGKVGRSENVLRGTMMSEYVQPKATIRMHAARMVEAKAY